MSLSRFTPAEQLEELEIVIADFCQIMRGTRGVRVTERRTDALKSIATDLRAREPKAAGTALRALQERLANLVATKTEAGWDEKALVGIAQQVIGYWPTIRQALERCSQESAS